MVVSYTEVFVLQVAVCMYLVESQVLIQING